MRHVLVSLAFYFLTVSLQGQTAGTPSQPCRLKPSQAPAVRGVKLDMTVDELVSLFPGLDERINLKQRVSQAEGYSSFGYLVFDIDPSSYSTKDKFAGIGHYRFQLFDRRVVTLYVYYPSFPTGARWQNIDDLVQRFANSLHLPNAQDWTYEGSTQKRLTCDGFEIVVSSANDRAQITFDNPQWVQTQKERLTALEEQKRREFKP